MQRKSCTHFSRLLEWTSVAKKKLIGCIGEADKTTANADQKLKENEISDFVDGMKKRNSVVSYLLFVVVIVAIARCTCAYSLCLVKRRT